MFELDDERAISRGKHDAPVTPIPPHIRARLSESAYLAKVSERAERKDAAIRADAANILDRAIGRISEYQTAARASVSDMPLVRHYAFRYKQLKENVGKLTAELLLRDDSVINPQKTIVFYTGLIRDLLNTPVEMPKSSVKIMTAEEYQRQLRRSRAMSPAVHTPQARKPGKDYIPHFAVSVVTESYLRAMYPKTTAEEEKAQLAAILAEKKAKRLAELG